MKVTIHSGKKEWATEEQKKEFEEIGTIDVKDKHEAYKYVNEVVKEKLGKNKNVVEAVFVPEDHPFLESPPQKKKLTGAHIFVYWEEKNEDVEGHRIQGPDRNIIVPGKGW